MTTTEMMKIQFYDSYNMLKEFVRICPEELYRGTNHGLPIWNHVAHAVCGCIFWLREDYSADPFGEIPLPQRVRDIVLEDEWSDDPGIYMTKQEAEALLDYSDKKLEGFWSSVNDDMLDQKILDDHDFTYLSVISAQIRHIMCHVGMCSSALIENGYDEVKWIAYGEN